MSQGRSVLGTPRLSPSERAEAIAQPGPSWKTWAIRTGIKPWFGLLLIILDGFVLATLVQPSLGPWRITAVLMLPVLGYLDFVAYALLYAAPPEGWRRHKPARRSLRHPITVGIWSEDYPEWKRTKDLPVGEVPPEEFL